MTIKNVLPTVCVILFLPSLHFRREHKVGLAATQNSSPIALAVVYAAHQLLARMCTRNFKPIASSHHCNTSALLSTLCQREEPTSIARHFPLTTVTVYSCDRVASIIAIMLCCRMRR